jgi:hypothetical protein
MPVLWRARGSDDRTQRGEAQEEREDPAKATPISHSRAPGLVCFSVMSVLGPVTV